MVGGGLPLSISLFILRTPPYTIILNTNCNVDLCHLKFFDYFLYVEFYFTRVQMYVLYLFSLSLYLG